MSPLALLLGVGLLLSEPAPHTSDLDLAHVRELLHDRQDPRGQSQAALLLIQSDDPAAEKLIRQGLRAPEDVEVFLALVAAVHLRPDARFTDELTTSLIASHPRIRQVVAETLAVLPDPEIVDRLQTIASETKHDLALRQMALWTLGRSGRKAAVEVLLGHLSADNPEMARMASLALTELTGQNYGSETARWKEWWARHKKLTNEQWLELRLAFQTSRAGRLEGDLGRSRAQVIRLHQQLYNRLPVAEKLAHIQSLLDQDDPAVRALAVIWTAELLPTAAVSRQKLYAQILLRLSHDGSPEVQRAAVLALGRVHDPLVFDRLRSLLQSGSVVVRTASARALSQYGRLTDASGKEAVKDVVPLLQKALDDPALEVVVEAAEALGVLGAPEAGPVLTGLLRHPAEGVRQTAAQALERIADGGVLDGILRGLDDPCISVRFSLVGAVGRAAGDGHSLSEDQRARMLARLELLLRRDSDPGVRSRAASVLGEFAAPAILDTLWRAVLNGPDGRVQEKAWDAFVEVIARSGNLALLQKWNGTLTEARQGARRLQLLAAIGTRWNGRAETRAAGVKAQEMLVAAQLEMGKWPAAAPLVRELLAHSEDSELPNRLGWLLTIGEQALKEGNHAEANRAVQDAQPYLRRADKLVTDFERLEKLAAAKGTSE
jgi:HEAT repeat protein